MAKSARFVYTTLLDPTGAQLIRPLMSIDIINNQQQITTEALVDSGADANILPYQIGLYLGADWDNARSVPTLGGILGQTETRAIALEVAVHPFASRMMVFIWVKTDLPRLILGQINFFQEFEVCFFAANNYFELRPKG